MSHAGALRERVTVQKRTAFAGKFVQTDAGWEDVVIARPAKIAPVRGDEEDIADRLVSVDVYDVTLRGEAALRAAGADWQIVDVRTRQVYRIRLVTNPDMRGRWIVFRCERHGGEVQPET